MRKPFYLKSRKGWYLKINQDDGSIKTVRLDAETKADAYDAWQRMRTAVPVESTPDESPTVVWVVTEYLKAMCELSKLAQLSPTTVSRRTNHISPFILAIDPDMKVDELRPHHVTTWLATKKTWGATTRHDCVVAIKKSLKWAVDEGRIESNPIGKMKVAGGQARDHVVSRAEHEVLLANVWKTNYSRRLVTSFRQILVALWLSGCRPSELLSIDIRDTDQESWTIRKHKNIKKNKRPRVVYLSPCLQTLTKMASNGRTSGPLFQATDGRGWKYSDIRRRFERLRKRAKVDPKCVLYSFRHTWITDSLVAGVDVATVAELAGTSIQMIDRHYGHLCKQRKHLAAAVLVVGKSRIEQLLSNSVES